MLEKDYTSVEQHAIAVVDAQLAAYNKRDIEAFIATYHDNVKVYQFPNTLLYAGKLELKARYQQRFDGLKQLQATITQRMVRGHRVVDYEIAQSIALETDAFQQTVKLMVVYEVIDGFIQTVMFMRDD